ncbi:MAG: alanine racemase, partial [Noviherbaspirillum sp.]
GVGASLAASPGFYLGSDFHFDMVRLGSLVHGMESSESPSPLEPAIKLETKITEIRIVNAGEGVGYGRTGASDRQSRKIATLACGFGDGLPRGLNNSGKAFINGKEVPIVSKVMMDMVEVDVTDIDESLLKPGMLVQLLGPEYTIDDMAEDAKTIAADITTSLQDRVYREVVSGGLPFQQAQAEREELAALSRLPDLFVPDQHAQRA